MHDMCESTMVITMCYTTIGVCINKTNVQVYNLYNRTHTNIVILVKGSRFNITSTRVVVMCKRG